MPRFTLLTQFSVASLALLAVIGVLLGMGLTRHFEEQAIEQQKAAVASLVPPVIGPYLSENVVSSGATGDDYAYIELALSYLGGSGLVRVKVWNTDGLIVYSDEAKLVGARSQINSGVTQALDGSTVVEITPMESAGTQEERGYGDVMKVYVPLPMANSNQVVAAFEGYYDVTDLRQRVSYTNNYLWFSISSGFLCLYLLLFTIVRNASKKLIRQSEENAQLFTRLQRSNRELALAYDETLEGWSRALDLRDKETEGHSRRVTEMALRLAKEMGVSEEDTVNIYRGALLHDIGKVGIPDSILLKPGPLDDEEWRTMRMHPVYAYELLRPISFLEPALAIPHAHHEKWDGTGYPLGLKGEEIPLAARIFAVADVWDALRSNRPYRSGRSRQMVIAYITEQAGKHFDPAVVEAFVCMEVATSSLAYNRECKGALYAEGGSPQSCLVVEAVL